MPQQVLTAVENNFTRGLITEATGLNFPENAATSASNCIFTLIGDVVRREGFNFELNGTTTNIPRALQAMSTYVWNNPGGDGNSKLLVKQVGATLYFYNIANATVTNPLSTQLLVAKLILTPNPNNQTGMVDATKECQYADGNGYLFVFHPSIDPLSVTYVAGTNNANTISGKPIQVQIRDFIGVTEPGVPSSFRPTVLTTEHSYNIQNQGWTAGSGWSSTSQTAITNPISTGAQTLTIGTGITAITAGDLFTASATDIIQGVLSQTATMTGTVTSYTSGTGVIVLNVTSVSYNPNDNWNFPSYGGDGVTQYQTGTYFATNFPWNINSINKGLVNTWHTAEGNYPSNSDIWWLFRNTSGVFDPANTQPNLNLLNSNAPQGHFILNAFNQDRNTISGLTGITAVTTQGNRPSNGAWFQGRVWYSGMNAIQQASGDANFYTWTENIYFSQIIQTPSQFGLCYQQNDPTGVQLNSILPTDGGVITIVGSGTIHKLFPIANGLLVFANNGVWYITGSTGIGFSATDFTITKISAVKVLSNTSFIDVLGLPYFWNEEGIYQVTQAQNGQLQVLPLTVGTILTYYNNIPLASKKFARGSYDPINYTIQWCYRSTLESSITDRYQFDTILNFNTFNKAFFPYNLMTNGFTQFIHGVDYISYPYISNATPLPDFKYHCSELTGGNYLHGFAEEYDTTFNDWGTANYTSSFATGYKLHGQALHRFQSPYVYSYSRTNGQYSAFYIQGVWDYAITLNSNKLTMPQFIEINDFNSNMIKRRHRIRGRGTALQLQFTSVPQQPFDLMGWALYDNVNVGV